MIQTISRSVIAAVLFSCLAFSQTSAAPAQQPATAPDQGSHSLSPEQAQSLRAYIHSAWQTLSRSQTDCHALADPKLSGKPVLYLPANFEEPAAVKATETKCGIKVAKLPREIHQLGEVKYSEVGSGLLYLPNPYVVPGGRFNEMYGWDSYFIVRGLVRDNELELARDMIENFFFEIEHYGSILNANRTYYLTRSQPPFLTSMVMSYWEAQKNARHEDRQWLARAYQYAARDHDLWTHDPKLAGDTGLSRYFDVGDGPVPEMGDDPTYYSDVTSGLFTLPGTRDEDYLVRSGSQTNEGAGPVFQYQVCAASGSSTDEARRCTDPRKVRLSSDYYKGDRAMRESGFDISFRFGPYSGSTHHYAPVCLNSLLFKAEMDLAQMAELLKKNDDAAKWKQQAQARQKAVNEYLWNSQAGMFYDYNFDTGHQSTYNYSTAFYPLWAGLATKEQAEAVANNLSKFEKPGGIAMSDRETGMQWDLPYGWAPLQLLTVEGLRRYGFDEAADRVSQEFVSDVYDNFKRDGTIREKYDVITRSTQANVSAGYKQNVVGFGWTNGVTLVLMDKASATQDQRRASK